MKQRLMRPTAALFPMVGLAGIFLDKAEQITVFYNAYFCMLLFSLCAVDCFRNAAAQEPGVKRVDRRFSGSFLLMLIGVALTALIYRMPGKEGLIAAAALIYIEHLFEERMYALGRRLDGVILSCIANGVLLVGILFEGMKGQAMPFEGFYMVLGAGLAAVISIITSYAIEPAHDFSLKPINIAFWPDVLLKTLPYIVAATGAVMVWPRYNLIGAILFGLIPWRLARTNFRRAADESRPLNLLLIAFTAIPAAITAWIPEVLPYAAAAGFALVCSAIVFCAPGKRLYIGIALTAAAFIPFPIPYINAALALAAIIINTKQAFLRKV